MTAYTDAERHLLALADGALRAAAPGPALRAALSRDGNVLSVAGRPYDLAAYRRVSVLGAGKASAAMAGTLESLLGDRLHQGLIATQYGHSAALKRVRVMESGHPVPDAAGERAAEALLDLAGQATGDDLVFFLLSGGASAIAPAPRPPVTLAHKQEATRSLLKCGAAIHEINAVRKHLSRFKGGHLAKALEPATVVSLIISDVPGDRLDVIGSGPTAPDDATFHDCRAILDKYALCGHMPEAVNRAVLDGCAGRTPETRKPGDACFDRVQNEVIASNAMALDGAAAEARRLGWDVVIADRAMAGEARETAARMVGLARKHCEGRHAGQPPLCLLAGGETTVTVHGPGKGGRNQEFALAAAVEIAEHPACRDRLSVLCLATDGTDGPTDAAGAMVFPDTLGPSGERLDAARRALKDNDAYPFLADAGVLLRTGPTLTNVMDVAAILIAPC